MSNESNAYDEYTKYSNMYYDKFEDTFPIMQFRGINYDEAVEMIKECLNKGEPIHTDDDVVY